MPGLLDNSTEPDLGPTTFAQPDESLSFGERVKKMVDLHVAAGRSLVDLAAGPQPSNDNLNAATSEMGLTPQEQDLYRRHLTNLYGNGGVDNPNGSRSTLFQMSFERDGKTYNIPTVWDGKILKPDEAIARADQEGIDKFPSYGSQEEAEARYGKMHDYMERDTGAYFASRNSPLRKIAQAIHPFTPVGIGAAIGTDLAERPGEFPALFGAAERQTRLVDTMWSEGWSREEAYDRRIKAVKDATGVTLENPERGGYGLTERDLRKLSTDGPIDPATYRRQQFEQAMDAARAAHPGQADNLAFGNIDEEAKAIASGAEADYERARHDTKLSTASSLVTQLGGGMWGQRRDPLVIGSLFAGPTSAVGRTVAARIASSSMLQGLYNAGLTALEQPAVQAWRNDLGLRSGAAPAAENVGLAFLFGAIPGAVFRGVHEIPEMLRPAVKRVIDGAPEAGDIEKAMTAAKSALGEIDAGMKPVDRAAIKMGDEVDAAERVTAPRTDAPAELHDDLTVAAQRHGDDPIGQPSPAAVEMTSRGPPEMLWYQGIPEAGVGKPQRSEYWTTNRDLAYDYAGSGGFIHVARNSDLPPGMAEKAMGGKTDSVSMGERRQVPTVATLSRDAAREEFEAFASAEKQMPAEVSDRIAAANPATEREAQMAASEALEDIGNRQANARTRVELDEDRLPAPSEGFTTAKGSTYELHADGTTTRNKAARTDVGHEGDSGAKPRTEKTVYVDTPQLASALSAAGLQGLGSKGARVIIKDGKASLLTWNERAGQWGRSKDSTDIPVSNEPAVGKAPLELWKKADDIPGYEAYKNMHAGNAITELRTNKPAPASSKDPLDKIATVRDDGTPTLASARQAARQGEREMQFAELIRECK